MRHSLSPSINQSVNQSVMGYPSGREEMLEFDQCFTLLRGAVECPDKLTAPGSSEMRDFNEFHTFDGVPVWDDPRGEKKCLNLMNVSHF